MLIRALTRFGPISDVADVGGISLSLPASAWLAALVGAGVAIASLMLPVGPAIRRTVVTHQQDVMRGSRTLWWQRAYLDVIVLGLGLLLLWRLRESGGIGGNGRVDWLLLLSPVALLLGAGTILLRIFPLLLRFGAWVASRGRGLPAALSLWQAARNPTHIARLVLLLTLAMALGILSSGLNATLDQSEFERANYAVGSDIRLTAPMVPFSDVASGEGIEEAAGWLRDTGSIDAGRAYYRFDVLGIEPFSTADVTLFREDFATQPMGNLLGRLVSQPMADGSAAPPMLPLPGQPGRLGVWLWSPTDSPSATGARAVLLGDSDLDRVGVRAKVMTAQNRAITLRLQPADPGTYEGNLGPIRLTAPTEGYPADGWRYFEAEIEPLAEDHFPLQLHSLWLQNRARGASTFFIVSMRLAVDDITVIDRVTGRPSVVESFEEVADWASDDGVSRTNKGRDGHWGQSRMDLTLNFARTLQFVGIKPVGNGRNLATIPILASPTFLQTTGLTTGAGSGGESGFSTCDFPFGGGCQYVPHAGGNVAKWVCGGGTGFGFLEFE